MRGRVGFLPTLRSIPTVQPKDPVLITIALTHLVHFSKSLSSHIPAKDSVLSLPLVRHATSVRCAQLGRAAAGTG